MDTMDWLFQLSAPVLLMLALNVIGLAIKKSPLPDWVIVWALPVLGGVAYPFIAGASPHAVSHPPALNVVYGVIIGGGSVWGNQLLRQSLAASSRSQPVEPPKPPTPPNP